jgi:dolichol-phosphate mannosyltransferase
VSIVIALFFAAFSSVVLAYSIFEKIVGNPFSGYTSIIVLLSFGFSLLFFMLGIMSEYIGNIFVEVKKRPVYILRKK